MPAPVKRHEVSQPLDQSYRLIPLTRGQTAIVDVEDYDRLSGHYWNAHWNPLSKSFYAVRNVRLPTAERRYTASYMHNEVMQVPRGIDHKRCEDTLDNRKSNLRHANASQQGANQAIRADNKSGYKGVFLKDNGRYRAKVFKDRKQYDAGTHSTAEEAARAYDALARELHGEFAWLNFR
ncbi:MAG TPA: AP2 domain-containing protein [Candidatus Sulfotelmatobacter sp.]|jgi:hypothetical protein